MSTSNSQSDSQRSTDTAEIVFTIDQSTDGNRARAIVVNIIRADVWIAMPAADAPILFDQQSTAPGSSPEACQWTPALPE